MQNFEACIFDLDGVIVDTDTYHFMAWDSLAKELNISFTKNDNERLKGISRMASLDIVLSLGQLSFDEKKKMELAEKKNNLYKDYLKNLNADSILPGVEKLMQLFKQNNIKVGIGSSSKNAKLILAQIGLIEAFDVIIDGSMVQNSKPAPDIFLLGAQRLNVQPEKCLVIEDATAGIIAAIKANMKCIGVGDFNNLSEADLVVQNLKNLTLADLESLCMKSKKKSA